MPQPPPCTPVLLGAATTVSRQASLPPPHTLTPFLPPAIIIDSRAPQSATDRTHWQALRQQPLQGS